jgi:murein DD-endopeptidase MepM/ murein hydrolase activator NlpD
LKYTDRDVLTGEVVVDSITGDINPNNQLQAVNDVRSKEDSAFRVKIEREEEYTINQNLRDNSAKTTYFLFTPIDGSVSSSFNPEEKHFGIDVVSDENEAVKAVMNGTITLADWTSESGFVIQIQHRNNLVSIYKHCSALLKKVGDPVEAGEAIAIVGNTGTHTTGPHLHFELWDDGQPVNPEQYIAF